MTLGSPQSLVKMSNRNIPSSNGGQYVRLTTSPPSHVKCHEIWEPKPPATLWATSGLLRDSFTFTFSVMGNVVLTQNVSIALRKPVSCRSETNCSS